MRRRKALAELFPAHPRSDEMRRYAIRECRQARRRIALFKAERDRFNLKVKDIRRLIAAA